MSKTAHTPGPWWTDAEYDEVEMGVSIIAARTDCGPLPGNPTRGMVAHATSILKENASECEANARLIAAAPELLESLTQFRDFYPMGINPDLDDAWRKARAAIAKATGAA